MTLRIHLDEPRPETLQITLNGRLDSETAPQLDQQLAPVLETPPRVVVFDLADLEYISSAGIRSIVRTRKALQASGGKLTMLNPQPSVKKVFDIIKAVPVNEVFASTEELDDYLDTIQRQARDPD